MRNKSLVLAGVILAVMIGGALYLRSHKAEPVYTWNIVESAPDADGMPRTTVGITVNNGVAQVVGIYQGSCHELKKDEAGVLSEKPDTNEISRVQCWFAGGGDEVGIFKMGDEAVVKVGELQEGSGEGAPFRGNFNQVLSL